MSRVSQKNVYKIINGRKLELKSIDIPHEAEKIIIEPCNVPLSSKYISISSKSLLVMGLVKNIQPNIYYLKFFLDEIKTLFKTVSFFYLTNNNNDNTCELLSEWETQDKDVHGIVIDNEQIDIVDSSGNIGNRVNKLAQYRNKLFKEAKNKLGCKYDFVLQMDTDLISKIHAYHFATCFDITTDFDIICANGVYMNSLYHYDVFALRLLDDPEDINEIYPLFSKYYGLRIDWVTKMHIFKTWTKVRCAWGGMMLFKNSIFNIDKLYDENCPISECEHLSLCRKFSNIYINPYLTYMQDYTPEGQCYNDPLLFVPRDAGFFSVFNFYIGMLSMCGRVYPFWNYEQFKLCNKGEPKHFCYFNNDNDNCWFDYFQKVEFYRDDMTHSEVMSPSLFDTTDGSICPDEFRLPSVMNVLLANENNKFTEWRHRMNKIFRLHIKLSSSLQRIYDSISSKLFEKSRMMIGVHYRHPSHCCEQGIVLLKDYFEKIDDIIAGNKDVGIFLATDTEFGILAFKDKYGSRVGYIQGIKRTPVDNLLEWAYARGNAKHDNVGFINNKGYEVHHIASEKGKGGDPQLGYDVILEVLCLSKCDWFIHTVSNLSLAVSYMNPYVEMIKL